MAALKVGDRVPDWLSEPNGWGEPLAQMHTDALHEINARRRECFWWRVGAGLLAWAIAAALLDRYLHWLDLLN